MKLKRFLLIALIALAAIAAPIAGTAPVHADGSASPPCASC